MREKTAVIYARVSDLSQAEEELSIPSQIERGHARAAELGARVDRVFVDEGKSARSDARPDFQAAIAHCEAARIDFFITWSTSRFARNKIDAGTHKARLDMARTQIVYVSQNFNRDDDTGWMTESMFEIFDEMTSRQISKDTQRSMETNARNGCWNGGKVPFGFQVSVPHGQEKRKKLVRNESEAPLVKEIFNMRIEGKGSKTIAEELNKKMETNRGRRWTKAAVGLLLRNEVVVGNIVFGRRRGRSRRVQPRDKWVVVPSHEPIIDQAQFDAVQSLIRDADMGSGEGSSTRSMAIFTGMLRCGKCGGAMTTESATGRSKTYRYYNCRAAIVHRTCPSRRVTVSELDSWLTETVLRSILTTENLSGIVEQLRAEGDRKGKNKSDRRKEIMRRMEEAKTKRAKLFEILELHGKDAPNLKDLNERLRMHADTIEGCRAELVNLGDRDNFFSHVGDCGISELAAILESVIRTSENPKRLRQFFSTFVERIVVSGAEVTIEYRPGRLFDQQRSGAVHSEVIWLPGTDSNRRPSD